MKACFIISLVLSVMLMRFKAVHSEERVDRMKAIIKECSETTQISQEDLAKLKESFPETPAAKCFVGCIMSKAGSMDDSYRINQEGIKNYFARTEMKEEHKKIAMEISQACQKSLESKYGTDRCQNAEMTLGCYKDESEKRNIDPWKFQKE